LEFIILFIKSIDGAAVCSLGTAVLCKWKKTTKSQSGDEKRKRAGEVDSEEGGVGKKARKADKEPVVNGAKGIAPLLPLSSLTLSLQPS